MSLPNNLGELNQLLNFDITLLSQALYKGKRIIFYDTNSFYFHSRVYNGRYYALDFFESEDIIIITDTILEELSNNDDNIVEESYIKYFRFLSTKVKNLFYINERDAFSFLNKKYQDKHIKILLKKIYKFAFQLTPSKKNEISNLKITSLAFLDEIYQIVYDNNYKKNRGEISIIVILLIFSEYLSLHFLIFSDDYTAYKQFHRLIENEKIKGNSKVAYMSTVRNICHLYRKMKLTKTELMDYVNGITREIKTKIIFKNRPYDTLERKSFSNEKLVDFIHSGNIEIVF